VENSSATNGTSNPISRRRFLARAGTGAVAMAAAPALISACSSSGGSSGSSSSKEVVYAGFGGAYQDQITEAVLKPFQDATGIKVTITTGAQNISTLKAMVDENKVQWDIMDTNTALLAEAISSGVLQKVDYSKVPGISDLETKSLASTYGLGYYTFSDNLYWNTKGFQGTPTSWADVYDTQKFPGKRGFTNDAEGNLEIAVMAAGVPIDKVYPIDLDLAFNQLDKIRSSAVFLDDTALQNEMAQQDVVVGCEPLSRTKAAAKAGAPLTYTWSQAIIDVNSFAIPAKAPHPENALKLMQFALQPTQQLAILRILGYGPVTKAAFKQLSPAQLADMPGSPQNAPQNLFFNSEWYAQNGTAVTDRFQKWLVA